MIKGKTCTRITSFSECEAAAAAIGLSDTIATSVPGDISSYYPPYCYIGGSFGLGTLYFNSGGTETVSCDWYNQCICHAGM